MIPCGGVHLEELELCENVYLFCCCRSTLGHQRKKFFICWRRKGIKSVNWKQRLQVNRYSKTPLNEPILFVDLLSTTHVVDQCDQGKQQTLWLYDLSSCMHCIAVSVLPVFLDMASLLREQTRVKESLEGALEKQKEGNHSNKFLNVCACHV